MPNQQISDMSDTSVEVTIGWTMSDRANGYSSFDGYRPGARQHTETIVVDLTDTNVPMGRIPEAIAEAVFVATNMPRLTYPEGLTGQICRLIDETDYHGREAGHYSLSVGDTVTVSEVMLACESTGWRRVTDHSEARVA